MIVCGEALEEGESSLVQLVDVSQQTPTRTTSPYGSWPSPVKAEDLIAGIPPSAPEPDGEGLYWLELRPSEDGRTTLVYARRGESPRALTPRELNVRSRVHEYGGGASWRDGDTIYFSNFWDGRVYRQERDDDAAVPITPEPREPMSLRYADGVVTDDGWIVAVRESHEGPEVENELVLFPGDGSAEPRVIASGRDFYAAPRLSPDGSQLAFLAWDHPLLPFVGCELWVGSFAGGEPSGERHIAGGPDESIFQPEWSPDGVLHFSTDRTGFWNVHRLAGDEIVNVAPVEAEIAYPHWTFGLSRYAFLGDGRIACIVTRSGYDSLEVADPQSGRIEDLGLPFTSFVPTLKSSGSRIAFVAASETQSHGLYELDVASGELTTYRAPADGVGAEWISRPEQIEFAGSGGKTSYAFYYPPTNPEAEAPEGELPPLRVLSHGGPTGNSAPDYSAAIQFWTTRGFGVVDVNYGGSTGYGRAYRERLDGKWGIVDVEDCVAAAQHLVATGRADPKRLWIEGGSAGGYTTLCALVDTDVFAAGVNHFGVADLETFARDTHKFEARYLDLLVGSYPERKDLYEERSPVNHFDRLSCPVLTFQGLDDRVVPPSQSEQLVDALERKGLPYAYLAFEGEGHGFRKRESILRVPDATLYFLSRIFGFEPADELEPIQIANLEAAEPS
jgi:dipeptidyl aminopeptidase/acylaminoacyl peptidase